jgi:hypothetical protein
MLWRWRCVRWQWSLWRPRLRQGLIITAQGGTLARIITITTTSGITAIATSRKQGAWTPGSGSRARQP